MVFLKHFDTSKQTLLGAGKIYMTRTSKVADLVPIINERMRWAPGTALKLYEVRELYYLHSQSLRSPLGNQTWNDRTHEVQTLFRTKRNSGRRRDMLPSGFTRERVRSPPFPYFSMLILIPPSGFMIWRAKACTQTQCSSMTSFRTVS